MNIVDASNDNNLPAIIAKAIQQETTKPDKSFYNMNISKDSVNSNFSDTLLNLLAELKLPNLPTSLVASVIN
jgi:hypothetical protein